MSKQFEVRVTERAFIKGDEGRVRKEWYDEWQQADKAFVAYNTLVCIEESAILFAELIEHRQEVVHKRTTA